jgi:hypothetical protein
MLVFLLSFSRYGAAGWLYITNLRLIVHRHRGIGLDWSHCPQQSPLRLQS